ncbi:hypothetical protein JTE90_024955 [Oedothorax gibbosus]|uniref:Uncharacterized protein n=1 Tax=Oedothorax gibbosus TaxID=931172 RepID=A0AAV6VUF6_9ARAC|nr:hypothetical protein JTE90_024955 [Oedothorax gibbosus]
MQDEDFDTDQYEEKFLTETDKDFDEDLYEETIHKKEGFDKFSRREGFDEKRDTSAKDKYYSRKSDYSGKQEQEDWYGRDLHDKPSRSWSHRPDKRGHRLSTRNKSDDRNNYYSVAKWQVDYNNKNYIRSKLNKHGGFHRYALGRPLDWDIEYDNMYYLRSFVNAPKGMHRVKQDIKRKLVPDKDILADSTGWEFEYGPVFKQEEGDVPFMPEERIVSRGAYRYYGVRRNPSDCDGKIQEKQMVELFSYIYKEYFCLE